MVNFWWGLSVLRFRYTLQSSEKMSNNQIENSKLGPKNGRFQCFKLAKFYRIYQIYVHKIAQIESK